MSWMSRELLCQLALALMLTWFSESKAQPMEAGTGPVEVTRFPNGKIEAIIAPGPHGERIAITRDGQWKLFPPDKYTVIDIDGNAYRAVRNKTSLWMIDNLRTTRFADGSMINAVAPADWAANWQAPARAQLDGGSGYVYNWAAVATNKLCPSGWRVPSRADFWNLQGPFLASPPLPANWGRGQDIHANLFAPGKWPVEPNPAYPTGFAAAPEPNIQGVTVVVGRAQSGLWAGARFYTSEINGEDPWFLSLTSYKDLGRNVVRLSFYDGNNPSESRTYGLSVRCVRDMPTAKDLFED